MQPRTLGALAVQMMDREESSMVRKLITSAFSVLRPSSSPLRSSAFLPSRPDVVTPSRHRDDTGHRQPVSRRPKEIENR